MKKFNLLLAALAAISAVALPVLAEDTVKPTIITSADFSAGLFGRPDVETSTEQSDLPTPFQARDFMPFTSSDGKLFIGAYQTSGHHRYEIEEPYGVDEYMHFLSGGVTLTSKDGTVMEVKAGDSIMVPKEWTGFWESRGYEKIYVIYDTTETAEH